jgi:hypothetical protein
MIQRAASTSAFFLEMLNGGAITPELLWLVLLSIYLMRETRRRGLNALDWFALPPSMDLILAVFISDSGVCLRSVTIWAWRRFGGGGAFNPMQELLLIAGGALIVVGALCKIRALTRPDHGDGPWLLSMALTAVVLVLMLALR